jgi:GTP-binding protein HflX
VFNKLDLLEQQPRVERGEDGLPRRVWLSASTGAGIELLEGAIAELVGQDMVNEEVHLSPNQGELRAAFYNLGAVRSEDYSAQGIARMNVRMPRADWNRLMKKGPEPLF